MFTSASDVALYLCLLLGVDLLFVMRISIYVEKLLLDIGKARMLRLPGTRKHISDRRHSLRVERNETNTNRE